MSSESGATIASTVAMRAVVDHATALAQIAAIDTAVTARPAARIHVKSPNRSPRAPTTRSDTKLPRPAKRIIENSTTTSA